MAGRNSCKVNQIKYEMESFRLPKRRKQNELIVPNDQAIQNDLKIVSTLSNAQLLQSNVKKSINKKTKVIQVEIETEAEETVETVEIKTVFIPRSMTPRQEILLQHRLAEEKKLKAKSRKLEKLKQQTICDYEENNRSDTTTKSGINKKDTSAELTKDNIENHDKNTNTNAKQYWKKSKKSKWEGNSDDMGSVDSGLLDENVCFECGLNTIEDGNWNKLLLCDACDGEYHIECVHKDKVPRAGFTCPRCVEEINEFRDLRYTVQNCGYNVRKRKGAGIGPPSFCYSPSRPLEKAWEECKEKGFMVVSKLFSFEIMKKLTHGVVESLTISGRVAEIWPGVIKEMEKRINSSCKNVVIRGGRFDMRLPEFVVKQLRLNELLEPLLSRLRTIMGNPKPILRTHNIVWVPVGSPEQHWHYDDRSTKQAKHHRYFTILIHLNTIDTESGGTEIWSKKLQRADMIRPRPGDAFVFNGTLMHRGQANNGRTNSFSCNADANTVELE